MSDEKIKEEIKQAFEDLIAFQEVNEREERKRVIEQVRKFMNTECPVTAKLLKREPLEDYLDKLERGEE